MARSGHHNQRSTAQRRIPVTDRACRDVRWLRTDVAPQWLSLIHLPAEARAAGNSTRATWRVGIGPAVPGPTRICMLNAALAEALRPHLHNKLVAEGLANIRDKFQSVAHFGPISCVAFDEIIDPDERKFPVAVMNQEPRVDVLLLHRHVNIAG